MSAILVMEAVVMYVLIPMEDTIVLVCNNSNCIKPHNYLRFPVEVGGGALRLYRSGLTSTSYTSGIVQIYYSNTWGNICDDSDFASTEANVICHQLGYSGYSSYGPSGTTSRFVCSLK